MDCLEPIPDYGDHIPLTEFINDCKSGFFIDYDGHGYATDKNMSRKQINPSDVTAGDVDYSFTHVVWFNK